MARSQARRARTPFVVLASAALLLIVAPAVVLGGGLTLTAPSPITANAPRPGESCPDQTPQPGASAVICNDATGPDPNGGGGIDLGGLLPVVGVAVAGGALALVAAFLVLRRRTGGPVAAPDPGEWWTCRNCGKTNVIGSPRCYACGTWQG